MLLHEFRMPSLSLFGLPSPPCNPTLPLVGCANGAPGQPLFHCVLSCFVCVKSMQRRATALAIIWHGASRWTPHTSRQRNPPQRQLPGPKMSICRVTSLIGAYNQLQPTLFLHSVHLVASASCVGRGVLACGGGGFGITPWCDDLVCSWRRLLADCHSLPFPWTLSLHRRLCPSASHHRCYRHGCNKPQCMRPLALSSVMAPNAWIASSLPFWCNLCPGTLGRGRRAPIGLVWPWWILGCLGRWNLLP